ncbi:YigZ family protein [Catenovulum sediminis]|uniref:YigZ family protein n=1 Tax=Catenovulum sediminis TaxID=1740262 RepID=A0ABV1RE03_9ALTE|nr:YigZ family protein [Catenovulum sediminis]
MKRNSYHAPSGFYQVEEVIKNSRFITQIFRVDSAQQAKQLIQKQKDAYPDARHHCSAFIAGHPDDSNQYGFSDDGEPSGTAGKPMLAVLLGSGLGNVLALSIRYFGGVKLGTGGLVKAYAGGVKLALQTLETEMVVPRTFFRLECEYHQFDQIQYWIKQHQVIIEKVDYTDNINMLLALDDLNSDNFKKQLKDFQLELQSLGTR